MRSAVAAALLALLLAGCREMLPPGLDEPWLQEFTSSLSGKVDAADVVLIGARTMSLREKGTVSLYRIHEVLKGGNLISSVMTPYPDVPDSVLMAYPNPLPGEVHVEPKGRTLIFLTRPPSPGKNMHLLGNRVDQGMIHALPSLVDRVRRLCRSKGR